MHADNNNKVNEMYVTRYRRRQEGSKPVIHAMLNMTTAHQN